MTLTVIGVNHKTAPIALREKIAIGPMNSPKSRVPSRTYPASPNA